MILLKKNIFIKEMVVVCFIVVLIAFFEYLGVLDNLRLSGQRLSQPVLMYQSKVIAKSFNPFLNYRTNLKAIKRIQDLELKYAEASSVLGEIESLRAENLELKKILENSDRKLEKTLISSPIISLAKPAVSVGKDDGVVEGSMVIAGQTLVGVISQVYESQSEVDLLFSLGSTPILAKTERGVQGLVIGDGKRVILSEIPLDAEINLNERVVTMGQKGILKDVFIGRIQSIESQFNSSSKKAILEQFVSFYEVSVVEIK